MDTVAVYSLQSPATVLKAGERVRQSMETDDNRAVEAVLSGNRDAYADLVRRYEARIRQYCLLLLRNAPEAEEAAQDVFVKAFQSLGRFRGQASFLTWAGRIAHNHCMDLLRKRSRQRTDSLDAIMEEGTSPVLERLAEPEAPEEHEMKEAVPGLLAAMREDYREILVLREVQDLSYDEIAATLGCSIDTVKSRLRRARADFQGRAERMKKTAGGRS